MINEAEFEVAFFSTRDTHPSLSKTRSHYVLSTFSDRYASNKSKQKFEQISFGELIRQVLNCCNISSESDRKMYAAVIGKYYSPRAQEAKRRYSKEPAREKAEFSPPPFGILVDRNGQQGWDL
jgi:hypothetical protein